MRRARSPRIRILCVCVLAVLATGCSDGERTADRGSAPPGSRLLDVEADGTEPLEPGAYGLSVNGAPDQPLAVLTVPEGLYGYGGYGVGIFPDTPGDEPYRTLTYWTITEVFTDPCGKMEETVDAGTSVDDLVRAFQAQRRMEMSPPTPVVIDGHSGAQFDLLAPDDVVYEDCAEGFFGLWANAEDGGRYLQEPGQLVRMRVLDVDGHRVVISTSVVPGEGDAEYAELDALAAQITFSTTE